MEFERIAVEASDELSVGRGSLIVVGKRRHPGYANHNFCCQTEQHLNRYSSFSAFNKKRHRNSQAHGKLNLRQFVLGSYAVNLLPKAGTSFRRPLPRKMDGRRGERWKWRPSNGVGNCQRNAADIRRTELFRFRCVNGHQNQFPEGQCNFTLLAENQFVSRSSSYPPHTRQVWQHGSERVLSSKRRCRAHYCFRVNPEMIVVTLLQKIGNLFSRSSKGRNVNATPYFVLPHRKGPQFDQGWPHVYHRSAAALNIGLVHLSEGIRDE